MNFLFLNLITKRDFINYEIRKLRKKLWHCFYNGCRTWYTMKPKKKRVLNYDISSGCLSLYIYISSSYTPIVTTSRYPYLRTFIYIYIYIYTHTYINDKTHFTCLLSIIVFHMVHITCLISVFRKDRYGANQNSQS